MWSLKLKNVCKKCFWAILIFIIDLVLIEPDHEFFYDCYQQSNCLAFEIWHKWIIQEITESSWWNSDGFCSQIQHYNVISFERLETIVMQGCFIYNFLCPKGYFLTFWYYITYKRLFSSFFWTFSDIFTNDFLLKWFHPGRTIFK